jgi:hypothetical protein
MNLPRKPLELRDSIKVALDNLQVQNIYSRIINGESAHLILDELPRDETFKVNEALQQIEWSKQIELRLPDF